VSVTIAGHASERGAARRRPPLALLATGMVVAGAVALPLAFLVLEAAQVGWAQLSPLLFRHLTALLLWNSVRLTVAVTFLCALLGVAAAWCTERTDLPWRRFWTVVLVIPLAMPDFVLGYSWISLDPSFHGYWGSVLVMTLGSYPLVYLPVAAAMRAADPALEDVARGLGLGRLRAFFRVTFHQIRPALVGGSLLVALILLAEFGTFEILRFQTFTTEIYLENQQGFNTAAACGLSLVLVLLGLVVLGAEASARGRRGAARGGPLARPPARVRLGRGLVPVAAGLVILIGLAIGVPLAALAYWFVEGSSSTLPPTSILRDAVSTIGFSATAAAMASAAAIPIALLVERHRARLGVVMERSTYLVQALPGLVVALSLVYFTEHYLFQLYQSTFELVFAYAIMFFPLALVAVRAGVAQAPHGLEEVARSLGHGRASVLLRVTLPILAPALVAGFALVFLSASTELTATLILHPTGVNTLATGFWSYTQDFSYGAAAPYALALLLVAVIPGALLGRWFERIAGNRPA
jgi:iron(III) transport system permease protein